MLKRKLGITLGLAVALCMGSLTAQAHYRHYDYNYRHYSQCTHKCTMKCQPNMRCYKRCLRKNHCNKYKTHKHTIVHH